MSLMLVVGFLPSLSSASTKGLKVHFVDVGQGDATLIQSPNGKTMLVDGGSKSSSVELVKFLKEKGVKQLDYVVATHPDADHIGGLIGVLENFKAVNFIDSGFPHTSQTYYDLLTLIDQKNINFTVPKELDKISLDEQLTIRVLHINDEAKDSNGASIVLKLTHNKVSFLLMGDADISIEDYIRKKYDVSATVLKNGHHGSKTSSSAPFISQVKPKVAILSYGKNNSYGHPDTAVEARLKNVGAKTYKTAVDCDITVTSDGVKYDVASSCGKMQSKKPSTPAPVKKSDTKPAIQPKPTQTYFKNCTELRKVYPNGVGKGHPAYQSKMDRDKDGWACER